jgi:hypothetical protein
MSRGIWAAHRPSGVHGSFITAPRLRQCSRAGNPSRQPEYFLNVMLLLAVYGV